MKTVAIVALALLALFCGGCSLYGLVMALMLLSTYGLPMVLDLGPILLLGFAVAGACIWGIKAINRRQ